MPTYKGVEVWIEDAGYRKLNHQEVNIDLVDDRTVTVKVEMLRNELFTIHCASPTPVFCDVFVITASLSRNRAARFHLDESLTASNNASASSVNHTEGQYKDHGLRTSKRQSKFGKLGTVEVEIRRIGEIIKGEPGEECGVDGGEELATEFSMIDDFDQPPWLIFHFDIGVKESLLAVLAPAAEHIRRHVPHRMAESQSHATSGTRNSPRISSTGGSSNTTCRGAGSECLHNSRKRRRVPDDGDGAANVGEMKGANSDQLYEEYQKEEAEELRLIQKLQERVQLKKTRNMELRRLLGETP
ncbi:hypothetical protein J3R82DRAFT_10799 [Butyriboletus roseoflavus]|nr:hypothetical protein J3R82DRAFT_10799 [Butyriboletus roseoflavus]